MSISEQRKAIILEIGDLERRGEKGEKVDARIRHCGKRLEALGRKRKRQDSMDTGLGYEEETPAVILSRKENEAGYKKWITPAIKNGIGSNQYRLRVSRGWDFEKAATQPLRKKKPNREHVEA